jgi:phage/plasmid primase-like uncharacterized protein
MTTTKKQNEISDEQIDRARAIRTEDVLRERGILKKLKGRNGRFAGPCPNCGGDDRFAGNLRKGLFICRRWGVGGANAISLVRFLDGCDFLCAVETLVGPPPDGKGETDEQRHAREQQAVARRDRLERERERREAADLRETIRYCDRLWARAAPLPREALTYLAERRIVLDDVPDQGGLRFLARCPFDGVVLPCVVARFTDAITNARGGLWRRPITGDKPKSLAPIKNHVIRLWPDEDIAEGLVIGEGVETVLAAATTSIFIHHNTLLRPAWACGCDDTLRHFPVLPGIEHLTILADNDAKGAGQAAARDCAERWAAAGREAEVLTPDNVGEDFNDLARRCAR